MDDQHNQGPMSDEARKERAREAHRERMRRLRERRARGIRIAIMLEFFEDWPAALIELGYLTADEARDRQKLAVAIAEFSDSDLRAVLRAKRAAVATGGAREG